MKKTTILLTIFAVFFAANTFAAKTIDGKKITEVKEWVMKNGKKDRLDKVTKYDAKGNMIIGDLFPVQNSKTYLFQTLVKRI